MGLVDSPPNVFSLTPAVTPGGVIQDPHTRGVIRDAPIVGAQRRIRHVRFAPIRPEIRHD